MIRKSSENGAKAAESRPLMNSPGCHRAHNFGTMHTDIIQTVDHKPYHIK
jgi:hypothetical protein